MSLIELRGVQKHYKSGDTVTAALQSIDLDINEGEFVAIVGPSGSGKSTLMHIMGLLDSPTSGTYLLADQQMEKRSDRELAKLRRELIGFVFQQFNLLPRLNVMQNVMLPMVYAKIPVRRRKTRALELLKTVGLSERANFRTNQISGGQTQRVAVARSLANNPKLILADEPTGNLDTKSSQAIVDLLKELNAAGNTIVIVTHNPEIAEQTGRIITVRDGTIVSDSATSKARPRQSQRPTRTMSRPGKVML